MLDQLIGHTSEVGLDIVKHQLRPRKGFTGFLRKNGLIRELDELRAFDEEVISTFPSIDAMRSATGICIHCLQDAGHGVFEPGSSKTGYIVATQNCEIHKFRGDLAIEAAACRFRNGISNTVGAFRHRTERERLPFAFVFVEDKLLGSCQQQLIRQVTKQDTGGLGDCFAFGVRTVDGLRENTKRVDLIKLHMLIAARRLWLENTISRIDGWVPVSPLGSDGVYRRRDWEKRQRNSIPRDTILDVLDCERSTPFPVLRRSTIFDASGIEYAHFPSSYELNDWAVPGLGGLHFGPEPRPAAFLEPEDDNRATLGRNGPRKTAERQSISTDDSAYTKVRQCIEEGGGARIMKICHDTGLTKKQVNRELYRMKEQMIVDQICTSPPVWALRTNHWLGTVRDEYVDLDRISDAREDQSASSNLTTTFGELRHPGVVWMD